VKLSTNLMTVFLLGIALLFTACDGSGSSAVPAAVVPPTQVAPPPGTSNDIQNLWDQIDALPVEPLSDGELAALSFMREEEKLARDV